MARSVLSILILCAAASPAVAQLTPEQRAQREASANAVSLERYRQQERDARDYAIAAPERSALRPLVELHERQRRYARMSGMPGPQNVPFMGVGERAIKTSRLAPATPGTEFKWEEGVAGTITVATEVGAVNHPVQVGARIADGTGKTVWAETAVVIADGQGRYLIRFPPLMAGNYRVSLTFDELESPTTNPASVLASCDLVIE